MELTPRLYKPSDAPAWDEFVEHSWNGTFLHSRKFLAYHKDRFQDVSLVIEEGGQIVGVLPAAINPQSDVQVISHPGITYGGMIHSGHLRGQAMIDAFDAVTTWYRTQGFKSLKYKAVPHVFQKVSSSDDLYALFRFGARRYRCDLSAVIEYCSKAPILGGRIKGLKKAKNRGVVVAKGVEYLGGFWQLLESHLLSKFKAIPTHSVQEIKCLCATFPETIECAVALWNGQIVAGVILFQHPLTVHLQYSVANSVGYELSALDLLLSQSIEEGEQKDKKFFSFGTSSEQGGVVLNEGLHRYKTGFGAGGVVHEFYELPLAHA